MLVVRVTAALCAQFMLIYIYGKPPGEDFRVSSTPKLLKMTTQKLSRKQKYKRLLVSYSPVAVMAMVAALGMHFVQPFMDHEFHVDAKHWLRSRKAKIGTALVLVSAVMGFILMAVGCFKLHRNSCMRRSLEHFARVDVTKLNRNREYKKSFKILYYSDDKGQTLNKDQVSLTRKIVFKIQYILLVYLMVGYIFIVSSALEPWSCTQDINGRLHMKADPSVECQWCDSAPVADTAKEEQLPFIAFLNHLEYRSYATVAVIAASVYGLGIPMLFFGITWKGRALQKGGQLQDDYEKRFGFLTSKVKQVLFVPCYLHVFVLTCDSPACVKNLNLT
jgi:hypothetical protein